MFPSTITIAVSSSKNVVLNRVNQDNYGSEYTFSDATEACTLKIRHSTDSVDKDGISMKRHNVFFERIVYPTAVDLLQKQSFTATLRIGAYENPAVVAEIALGVNAWLGTGSNMADLASGIN